MKITNGTVAPAPCNLVPRQKLFTEVDASVKEQEMGVRVEGVGGDGNSALLPMHVDKEKLDSDVPKGTESPKNKKTLGKYKRKPRGKGEGSKSDLAPEELKKKRGGALMDLDDELDLRVKKSKLQSGVGASVEAELVKAGLSEQSRGAQ